MSSRMAAASNVFERRVISDIWLLLNPSLTEYRFEPDSSYYAIESETCEIVERGNWKVVSEEEGGTMQVEVIELSGRLLESPAWFLFKCSRDEGAWVLTRSDGTGIRLILMESQNQVA